MSLTTCRECGAQVSKSAKSCPHCGAPYPFRPSINLHKVLQPVKKIIGISILVVVGVFVALAIIGSLLPTDPVEKAKRAAIEKRYADSLHFARIAERAKEKADSLKKISDEEKNDVAFAAQWEVKQFLKAPSKAQFPPFETVAAQIAPGEYYVEGAVDAQNSFGAMLRSRFYATVIEDKASSAKWRVVSLNINGQTVIFDERNRFKLEQQTQTTQNGDPSATDSSHKQL